MDLVGRLLTLTPLLLASIYRARGRGLDSGWESGVSSHFQSPLPLEALLP